MNPFKEFEHFIAYFVPGAILFATVLSCLSLFFQIDLLLLTKGTISVTIIGSTVMGLFLDDARHEWVDDKIFDAWATKSGYDSKKKMKDFECYMPKIGVDVYTTIRNEYWYYYEFDLNVAAALSLATIGIPFYVHRFHPVMVYPLVIVSVLVLPIATLFIKFGKNGAHIFYQNCVDTISEVDADFLETIQSRRE